MNTGAFGEGFPYSNFHDLNMDWIIKIAKDFLDQYTNIQNVIETGLTNIDEETTTSLENLQEKYETLDGLLTDWYNTHSEDIANELAAALRDIQAELTSVTTSLDNAADAKLAEVLDSIPGDYTELGNAVTYLTQMFNSVCSLEQIKVVGTFTENRGIGSDGQPFNKTGRISTLDTIDISAAKTLSYTVTSGYRLYMATFSLSTGSQASLIHTYGWLTGTDTITLDDNEDFIRICISGVNDDPACTVADSNKADITYTTNLSELNKAIAYQGQISDNALDLDDVITPGIYNVVNNSNPIHKPDGFTGGTLAVFQGYGAWNNPSLTQILFSPYNEHIWMRFRSGAGTWNNAWIAIGGLPVVAEQTKWLAVGDSIVYGVYSYMSGDTPTNTVTTSGRWVTLLANALSYQLTIMASRGIGYTVTGQDPLDPEDPRISFDTLLTRIEAMDEDFNLVTVNCGINDYATQGSTIAGIKASVEDAIERLSVKFPNARIVFFTPFNTCRFGDTSSNYSYNHSNGGKTLKDVADAIKDVCYDNGAECIDVSNGFIFNNYNIESLELDDTHPTAKGHKLIAKGMVHYLAN